MTIGSGDQLYFPVSFSHVHEERARDRDAAAALRAQVDPIGSYRIDFRRRLLPAWLEDYNDVHPIGSAAPEKCGCAGCHRFAAARNSAYPAGFVELLRTLGTQPKSETEIFYLGETTPGHHQYGGWFHAVGRLLAGPDAKATRRLHYEALESPLAIGFTNARDLAPGAFGVHHLLQIEFLTEVIEGVSRRSQPVL